MTTPRRSVLALLATCALVALAVLAPAASAATTGRGNPAPVLGQPGPNATVRTVKPLFKWTLPTPVERLGIEVSRSNAEAANGFFRTYEWGTDVAVSATQQRVPAASSLWAGRWFWHVLARNAEGSVDSATRSFTIPLVVQEPILSGVVTPRGLSSFTVKGNMNSRNYRLEVAVYKGDTRCVSRTFAGPLPRKLIGVTTTYATGTCTAGSALPNNTVMKIVATAVSGDVRNTATKTFRT